MVDSSHDGTSGQEPRWARVWLLVLLSLAAMELASRVGVRQLVGQPFRSFDPYTFSGYGLYRQNGIYTHPQFLHNSAGFRNTQEFTISKPPNTLRVIAIGASVLYAGSAISHLGFSTRIHTDHTITAYLEPLLREMPEVAGMDVEVINTSVNRHNLRHTLSYYTSELARYDPDIVLVFGTYNDVTSLELVEGESLLFYDPEAPTSEERRFELLANEASLSALAEKTVRVAVNRSALAATAYRVLDRVMQQVGRQNQDSRSGTEAEAERLASPEQIQKNVRYYLAELDSLLSYIEVQGSRPVVFWEYLLLQVDEIKPLSPYEQELVKFLKRNTAGLSEERKRLKAQIRDAVAAHVRARGITLIDPLGDMREYSGDVYNDYLHYNESGNRWAAGIIARKLRPIVREVVTSHADR